MRRVLHKRQGSLAEGGMRGILVSCLVLLASFGADVHMAVAGGQGYPGGGGQMPGGRPGMGSGMQQPGNESISSTPATEKPDAAAKKAFTAGVKSLNRAREYEEAAAKAPNPDKKAAALDKVDVAFVEAVDYWNDLAIS